MSLGIVLEGGGMRGLYTAGVLDQFLATGIQAQGMVTVSAGALFGINYASQQQGRTLRYNLKYIGDKRYISLHNLLRTGDIVNKEFAFHTLPYELDVFDQAAFARSGIDFYATVTNVETGEPEYVLIKDGFAQMEALSASGSMPFVSKIVEYSGHKYLDGGVSDSIPVQRALELGHDKLIVILTRPLDYRKTKSNTQLADLFYRRYPAFGQRLKTRHQNYNETVEQIIELEKQGRLFVIRPSQTIPIKRLEQDPGKLQAMYDLGAGDAQQIMGRLENYLGS